LAEIYASSDLNLVHQIYAQEDGIVIQHTKTHTYLEGDELLWYGKKSKNVLFVCIGNTCRSPMASFIAKKLFANYLRIDSAGIGAENGKQASQNAIEAMKVLFSDDSIKNHSAKNYENVNLDNYDFIIAMDKQVFDYLSRKYPNTNIQNWDIADPYGKDINAYCETANEIMRNCLKFNLEFC